MKAGADAGAGAGAAGLSPSLSTVFEWWLLSRGRFTGQAIRSFDGKVFPHWDDAGWLAGSGKEATRGQCGFATALAKGDHHASAAGRSFYAWSLALGDNHEPTNEEKRRATCDPQPAAHISDARTQRNGNPNPRKAPPVCRRSCPCEPDRHGVSVWM